MANLGRYCVVVFLCSLHAIVPGLNQCMFALVVYIHLQSRYLLIIHFGCFAAALRVRFAAGQQQYLGSLMTRHSYMGSTRHVHMLTWDYRDIDSKGMVYIHVQCEQETVHNACYIVSGTYC